MPEPSTAAVRVVFADADDERTLAAVRLLGEAGTVAPVVIDPPAAASLPPSVETVSVDDPDWLRSCAAEYAAVAPGGVTMSEAGELVRDPLLFAALYTRLGGAEAGVAGATSTSPSVIRAGLRGIGRHDGVSLVSGCFLMEIAGQQYTYSDPSVVPDPTDEELATIACSAADCHQRITGDEPRVAMLSFSTHGSADHPDVQKVRRAVDLVRDRRPDLSVDGELQFDVAVNSDVAARKCRDSAVAGRANVLVFPDLGAANIAYKVTERFGGARAIGSFVLGLRRPWVDVSRGCSVEDIIDVAVAVTRMRTEAQPA